MTIRLPAPSVSGPARNTLPGVFSGADHAPPVGLGIRAGALDFPMATDQDLLFRLDGQQLLFELGEERLGFGQAKGPFVHRAPYDNKGRRGASNKPWGGGAFRASDLIFSW